MRPSTVSRRNAVTLVAGTLAVVAGPAAKDAAEARTTAGALAVAPLARSRGAVLALLQQVRAARGTAARSAAFERLTAALREYEIAAAFDATAPREDASSRAVERTTLYRQHPPDAVLASVIVRELEALPAGDTAWIGRFGELEAAVHARVRA